MSVTFSKVTPCPFSSKMCKNDSLKLSKMGLGALQSHMKPN